MWNAYTCPEKMLKNCVIYQIIDANSLLTISYLWLAIIVCDVVSHR